MPCATVSADQTLGTETDDANALKLLYNLYEARIRGYQENPPPEDWNGAFALLTK